MSENKKRILIVEDDEHISKVYKMKFSSEGYDIILAVDGEEGIEKITSEKPDLIILDLALPKIDGFTVLKEIKKNPELAKIPVLVLSNLGQQSDKDRIIALGGNEFMIKVDYSIEEVVNKAKSYLN